MPQYIIKVTTTRFWGVTRRLKKLQIFQNHLAPLARNLSHFGKNLASRRGHQPIGTPLGKCFLCSGVLAYQVSRGFDRGNYVSRFFEGAGSRYFHVFLGILAKIPRNTKKHLKIHAFCTFKNRNKILPMIKTSSNLIGEYPRT